MKFFRVLPKRLGGSAACFFSLSMLLPASVGAVTQQISATFRPDPTNPQYNEFINKTPNSGFCLDNPSQCREANLFSLRLPIPSHSIATIQGLHSNPRQGAMFNIPSDWQDIVVTHPTAPPQVVKFRVAGMGVAYMLPLPAPELTDGAGHNFVWEHGIWMHAGPPCTGLDGAGDDIGFNSFWRHPVGAGVCAKRALVNIPQPFRYLTFDITYELTTPNPLQMVAGQYTGQHVFQVGPHKDFDLGDIMQPEDNVIVLDFVLDVEHILKVEIPPGGNRVELEPQNGWQSWLQQGLKPTRLFRDQTFSISTSSRFKMNLECQYSQDSKTCSLYEPRSGHGVPLLVSVSLPHGLTDADGQTINRRRLLLDGSGTELFQPGIYVDRKPGTLHFEIAQNEVAEMIKPRQLRHYSGQVTIIWDSEV